ncbi:MAG: nicotinic acid mononucleotide adenyltransferase [Flavobacteriales bacterium CG_4_9_14_3_um_filter_40_17]|nr:MAG: nicotinic acid mononucleotide adenyltransferase [Flavobacteriales bacterium CG_4_9_14_3_um_filter_40_17]
MKKILFLALLFCFAGLNAQQPGLKLEKEGDLVKATYFYENGQVRQQGYFKDNKLDGQWISYREDGTKSALANYANGKKTGKWLFWSEDGKITEVDYSQNTILNVIEVQSAKAVVEN